MNSFIYKMDLNRYISDIEKCRFGLNAVMDKTMSRSLCQIDHNLCVWAFIRAFNVIFRYIPEQLRTWILVASH